MAAPVGSIWEVSLRTTVCGQRCINVLHYRTTTEAVTADIAAESLSLATAVEASVGADFLACLAQNAVLDEVVAQCIRDTLNVRFARQVLDVGDNGEFAQDTLTANMAAVIIKRTAFAGRWAVGTFHMPAIPDTTYSNGIITSAPYKGALGVLAAELVEPQTSALGGEYEPIIYHPTGVPTLATVLTSAEAVFEVRTMRRRTVGLGI